jgi:hypothetical protein
LKIGLKYVIDTNSVVKEIVKMIMIHCLDTEKNLRIFEVKDGSPELVKIALEKKGFKILSIGGCENV